MTPESLKKLLLDIREQRVDLDEAMSRLTDLPYENLTYARVDHHRELRNGFPEVVMGQGKSQEQVGEIAARILASGSNLIVTRVGEECFHRIKTTAEYAEFHREARMITAVQDRTERGEGPIAVVSAGTSDIPVAEEAAVTATAMGNSVIRIYDVGVAGIHRLLDARGELRSARAIVVVAGMEGALPSVVGGLVAVPVIAVPTSIGYGASFGGLAALLGMLNSCASNVTVVNIDNGFGAGFVASLINRKR
ncbi:MAG: nickel pincer cofactor biosynthesis protein LarB [Blastocatellia bacterium AA13]|nr:MAG: nickel pincer cofactor biosynthesis protein LarB [Blastocatellia bacterium AA13]